ncbi:MAG TPA: ferritin-like domain-containing protein [Candidatus Sulfotelmatobacter sp.]|jgi:ferritin-like metal-binding protein YciE
MKQGSLRDLYIDELRDLYSAENQLVKALPKMAKASSNEQLREAFEEHLQQTEEQVSRLEQIFEQLEEKPTGKKCAAMEGLVKEGAETMDEDYSDEVMDAAVIGAAQRVEHYEIAAYGTVREMAKLLGEDDQVSLIEETLEEEKQADQKLTELSQEVNEAAAEGAEEEQEREATGKQSSRQARGTTQRRGSKGREAA